MVRLAASRRCLHIRADQAFAGQVAERGPVFEIDHGQAGGERGFEFAQLQVAATPARAVGGGTEARLQMRVAGHVEEADFDAVARGKPCTSKPGQITCMAAIRSSMVLRERPDAIEAGLQPDARQRG